MHVFSFYWLVLPFRERNTSCTAYTVELKTYNCIVFTDFQHTKLYPFQNLSLLFILNIFLKFRKFQPRYSYKKKSVVGLPKLTEHVHRTLETKCKCIPRTEICVFTERYVPDLLFKCYNLCSLEITKMSS